MLKSSPVRHNPALEAHIQPWGLESGPGGLNPALGAHIQPWLFKSSPGGLNPALEAQIQPWSSVQPWGLKFSHGGSNAELQNFKPPRNVPMGTILYSFLELFGLGAFRAISGGDLGDPRLGHPRHKARSVRIVIQTPPLKSRTHALRT